MYIMKSAPSIDAYLYLFNYFNRNRKTYDYSGNSSKETVKLGFEFYNPEKNIFTHGNIYI